MKHTEIQNLPTSKDVRKELKRERYKQRFRRVLKSTVYALVIVAATAALVATMVLPVLQIAGNSMEPTFHEGQIVVLMKTKKLQHGDLCAFYYSNKVLIKRVIGLPGDYITIENDGTVIVNGQILDEPYVTEKALGECDMEFPYQVPENQYFLLGDQRATSIDSRSTVIGCITTEQMLGKIFLRIWPLPELQWFG